MSDTTIIIIVAFIVIVLLVAVAGFSAPLLSLRRQKKKTESLMTNGLKGEATVVKLTDTGELISDNPRMKILLEVHLPDHPSYQVEKIVTIPRVRLAQIKEGSIVTVLVDPDQPTNPDKVGILLR